MTKAILFNDTSGEGHYGCDLVIHNIYQECLDNDIHVVRKCTREDIVKHPDTINWDEVDIVIVNGEGTPHSGNDFIFKALDAIPTGMTAVLINSLWDSVFHMDICAKMSRFSLISVRDSRSKKELELAGVVNPIMVTPDVIFRRKHVDVEANETIGYCDSVLTTLRGSMLKRHNYFPMCYAATTPCSQAFINWMRGLEVFVTGRFHGACLAAHLNVPFLVFPSVSFKIEALLEDMGCEDLLVHSFHDIDNKIAAAKALAPKALKYALDADKKVVELFKKVAELS